MKQCLACKKIKEDNQFFKHNTYKDGLYAYCKLCKKEMDFNYRRTEKGYFDTVFRNAKRRAIKSKVAFDIDVEYLKSIKTELCPVFKTPLTWFVVGQGNKNSNNAPSLDRVISELGYVKGNVVFISNLANTIKSNVTEKELYAVADWLHEKRKEVLNAFKDRPTPLPIEYPTKGKGKGNATHGTVHGAGTGQDSDSADDTVRESEGQGTHSSTKASSGVSMDAGMRQMGLFEEL